VDEGMESVKAWIASDVDIMDICDGRSGSGLGFHKINPFEATDTLTRVEYVEVVLTNYG
jgi:hypothetical protein